MVMQARKLPKLSDGYTDKRDPHLFQTNQYPSKNYTGNYGEKYDRMRNSPVDRSRDDSPSRNRSPRYINKSSYIERTKEKLERGSVTTPEKKVNHTTAQTGRTSASSSNATHSNHDKNGRNSSREANPKDREQKTEVQKSAIRICGDWSEHISSSKKVYYYNCKTEVSQWEMPKDWTEPQGNKSESRTKDSRGSERPSSSKPVDIRPKHSLDLDRSSKYPRPTSVADIQSGKVDKQILFDRLQASQFKLAEYNAALKSSQMSQKSMYSMDSSKSDGQSYRKDTYGSYPTMADPSGNKRNRRDSEGSRSAGLTPRHYDHTKHTDSQQPEDMDISPQTTPTNSRPSSNSALQTLQKLQEALSRQIAAHTSTASASRSHPPQQSPRLSTEMTSPMQQTLKSPSITAHNSHQPHPSPHSHLPLHTLSQSQQPLQLQHHAPQLHHPIPTLIQQQPQTALPIPVLTQQHHLSHPPSMSQPLPHPHSQPIPQTQPHPISQPPPIYSRLPNHQEEEFNNGGHSPGSEASDRSCASPAPSVGSSQDTPVGPSSLTPATVKNENSSGLTPSLSNYYNERLIGHILGWQADHAQRQANRYWEEGINVGSLYSSQVSVDLKRARSLVRVAEIQSTLHEQRLLFLAQQIHELETMKPPSFTSSQ